MKNQIVTCISVNHPCKTYTDNFARCGVKYGKAYKCINELTLTSERHPEYPSLKGIAIRAKIGKWGWDKPCLPKECFRLATEKEVIVYRILFVINLPFRFIKNAFYKTYHRIDRIVRWRYYKEIREEFFY